MSYNEGIQSVKIDGRDIFYKDKHTGLLEPNSPDGAIYVTRRIYAHDDGRFYHWFDKEKGLGFSVPIITKLREHGVKYLGILFFYKGKTRRFRFSMDDVIHWPMYDGREHGDDWQYIFSFDPENTSYDFVTPKHQSGYVAH